MADATNAELECAEADLAAAVRKLAEAQRDIEKAEAKIAEAIKEKERREFKVEVLYDGLKKPFEVRHDELVRKLLDAALAAFGPLPSPHILALFAASGEELKDAETLEAAGVKANDVLLLRPSKVRGGAS